MEIERASHLYRDHDSAHGFDHVLRVLRNAEQIGPSEGAEMSIVRDAVLLHDIGRAIAAKTGADHAELGATMARDELEGAPEAHVEAVCEAITAHRFRGGAEPTSIEARVVYDADKLDAIGAIGIARAYAVGGAHRQRLWAVVAEEYLQRSGDAARDDIDNGEHTPVHEFQFKLRRIQGRMLTGTGKRMAQDRHAFMVSYFEQLEREVSGQV